MKKVTVLLVIMVMLSLVGCSNTDAKRETSKFTGNIDKAYEEADMEKVKEEAGDTPEELAPNRERMLALYGENKEIKTKDYDASLAAKTRTGTYVGKADDNKVVSWKGIPYAKQPVGDLRWRAPEEREDDDKVYEAYYFGHSSIQVEANDEISSLYPQGEDCLNLNIWNNRTDSSTKKPIMVWIHGGGFIQGGTCDPIYEGTHFVESNPDVLFVSIDYRTDILGFINLSVVPGADDYDDSANLGLLDEIAALNWIKENALAFGGDPERITIFGESAGGGSCSALTIIPQAKGLFNRAIMESGSCVVLIRSAEKSIAQTKKLLEITGAKDINDLKSLTADDLRKAADVLGGGSAINYTLPQLDGITLPTDIKAAFDSNQRNGIDIMVGSTQNEYNLWTIAEGKEQNRLSMSADFMTLFLRMSEEDRKNYIEFLGNLDTDDDYEMLLRTIDYVAFHGPNRYEAKTHADHGQNAYVYYFTEESTNMELLSYHGFELEFVFDNIDSKEVADIKKAEKLSDIMQQMWVNFAKSGDPSIKEGDLPGVGAIKWDKYTSENHNVMVLNSENPHQQVDPIQSNLDLIGNLFWTRYNVPNYENLFLLATN